MMHSENLTLTRNYSILMEKGNLFVVTNRWKF